MKEYCILFKTISIPFTSGRAEEYDQKWKEFIEELNIKKVIVAHSFFNNTVLRVNGQELQSKSYVRREEHFNGYLIVLAANSSEAFDLCKNCPVFSRKGEIQIRELTSKSLVNL